MESEKKVVNLDINDVLPNRFQPRIKFNEDSINELSESIKEHGVIQPIVVRPMGDKYEIIAGERRYKASLLAGMRYIPAIITDLNDKDSAEIALIENVQREDLTPIEEAVSYKKILDMGYLTQEELATKLGKSQSTIANKLRLLNLAEDVQEAVLEERISERHARSLLKLHNQQDQITMLNKIIENRLTVRKTDEEISKMLKPEPVVVEIPTESNKEELNINNTEGEINSMNSFNPFDLNSTNNNQEPQILAFDSPIVDDQASVSPVVNTIHPGFMDVSKIEETAQDINVVKPVANIDSLLFSPEIPKEEFKEEQEEPIVLEEPKEITNSKFFNLSFQNEETDSFNPFGQSNEPAYNEPKPLADILNDNNFINKPMETEQVNNISEIMTNDNKFVNNDVVLPFDNIAENNNSILPKVDMINEPASSLDSQFIVGSAINNEVQKKNIEEAITLVRNCSSELEKLGFKVNTEEIDLGNIYQVMFRIEK